MKTLTSEIESGLPGPLWDAYWAFLNEDDAQPFRRVHRLIDLIEVFCKIYTTASLATFLHAMRLRLEGTDSPMSESAFSKVKVMLAAGLRTPSLGIWWKFARDTTAILEQLGIPHILPGAEDELLREKSSIRKAFDGNKNLISFRNNYAHGATPSDAMCRNDIEETWPRMLQLLTDAASLRESLLVVCDSDRRLFSLCGGKMEPFFADMDAVTGHSWFFSKGQSVNAYPILSFRFQGERPDFFFYNDLKEKHANYLNYPNAEHLKDADLRRDLLTSIPIDEWRKIDNVELEPFRQQVEMLTGSFKGRKIELAEIASFLSCEDDRFLCIWGPPGVGKSALLARATQILRFSPEVRDTMEEAHLWPQGKIHLVEFFIRRGATETASQFFDSVNQRLDRIFNLRFEQGKTDTEKQALFQQRLDMVSKTLKDEDRLLIIADGLDEIRPGDPLLDLLPKILPQKTKAIYGGRPKQDLRMTFYEQLDRERRMTFDLSGLSAADIRGVLMEHVSKYEMHQSYVEGVLRISEGNPLYLKMLCRGLDQEVYRLNQTGSLPRGMDELYQTALFRLEKDSPGALRLLLHMAAAKDFVSTELAAEWMGMDAMHLRNNLLYPCLEFLYENPLTEGLEDYQLFHESLREYLSKTYPSELLTCRERICDWSIAWRKADGDPSYSGHPLYYAMHFAADHIHESHEQHMANERPAAADARKSQLFSLMEDESWRALNFETCGNGEALARGYEFLQRILAKDDPAGQYLQDFMRYTYNRYGEPMRMYRRQLDLLSQPVGRDRLSKLLDKTPSLAKMGERDEDRVMLAMLPLWSNDPQGGIPASLSKNVEDWLDNTKSTVLKKLWHLTRTKRQGTVMDGL